MNKQTETETTSGQPADLPEGMTRADTDVDNFPQWDFKNGVLAGKVIKVKNTEQDRRGKSVDVRLAVVEAGPGETYLLWESANLGDFFDHIKAGSTINVSQRGEAELSGQRTMKLYDAFYSS